MCLAQGVSKEVLRDIQRAGRPDLLGDAAQKAERDRADALSFELCADQTDRLVTGRSDRHQKRDVDLVFDHQPCRLWRVVSS